MACELLAPAGDFATALAALAAGADAVYCGLADFSARAFAGNLSLEELRLLLRHSARLGKRVYVAFNTVVDEDELESAAGLLAQLDDARPDGIIVQDLGVARLCRRHFPELELHASTQLVAHNLEGVLALRDLGFRRVVLARELSLAEIASIAKRCGGVELEVFVHGALCYSVSGLCLFGAMEKGRSGNRGKCPYCCRMHYSDGRGGGSYAFSMKDLRLGENVRSLADAGVASLKIEGRMKSSLYVASAVKHYRQILDGVPEQDRISVSDLETVFSRRTTSLYFRGRDGGESPVDPNSLGHLGAAAGIVKRVTKDREGRRWLRFHALRALEKHDGLQFEAMSGGKHPGMGIGEMRQAISRRNVFEVEAGTDVEVLIPDDVAECLRPGMKIYCSMSNAVKRMFPTPAFRPSDCPGTRPLDVDVTLRGDGATAAADGVSVTVDTELSAAKNPDQTLRAAEAAFAKLGGTDYRLRKFTLSDEDSRYAPASVLNELRRRLTAKLDEARADRIRGKVEAALADSPLPADAVRNLRTVKLRPDQPVPAGEWDEIVAAVNAQTALEAVEKLAAEASARSAALRLALPVYTAEPEFGKLRTAVKRWLRAGAVRWEASDLATLRMLKALGAEDVTADWTLYAFNSQSLALLTELGVRRFVASPENSRENLQYLAESGYPVEFLAQQSTPLFVSLTAPAGEVAELAVFRRDGMHVTAKSVPRVFEVPPETSVRIDLSWDPPC